VTALEETIASLVRATIARRLYEGSPVDVAVARHEGAHCLAAFATRAPALRGVHVDYAGGGETVNCAPKPAGTPDESREAILERLCREHPAELAAVVRRQCVTIFAGRASDEHGRADLSGWQHDEDEAAFLAESTVGVEERDTFLAPLRIAATSLVTSGWPVICELATLLSYERRIPGSYLAAWFEERPAARSLRDHYGAVFASVESA